MWTLLGTLRPAFLPARKLNCALIWTIWSKVHIPLLVLGKIKSAVNALRFDTQLDACLRTKWEEMMIQQHRSMDSKEESTICTCCFIPYWSCNGKNKLARHLLATSVVCFYACNDTLNSVVDSPPPHTHKPLHLLLQSISRSREAVPAKLSEWVHALFSLSVSSQDLVLDVVAFYDRIIPSM